MISKTHNAAFAIRYEASCDDCGTVVDNGQVSFEECVADIGELGWQIVRDEGLKQWFHYCPSCKK